MRIALTGNPNSGKTTMYNALTGQNEKVGNWAGVTVDKKEHPIKRTYHAGAQELVAVDLPGAYSMSPFTVEESITSEYVKKETPDVIINIVDATNLSRSLFFTTQLLELGIPMVVALNKADINRKQHTDIDTEKLSALLGCPVIDTVSTSAKGLEEVVSAAVAQSKRVQHPPYVQGNVDVTDRKAVEAADRKRFSFVNQIVKQVESRKLQSGDRTVQDIADRVLTSRLAGIPIFAAVMFAVFWLSQQGPGAWIAEWLGQCLGMAQEWIGSLFQDANPLLYALLIDGVIGGVIAVVGFLPLVMMMYFLIALLEDCGYMARVSVVLDPIFKKVGLSGKSVIAFIIGTGCAVPGVMACRTIRNERERRATAMLVPFMPCGAKLPVISLFAGAFFQKASWVGPVMYFAGILIIFLGALLVNAIAGHKPRKSYFIMELPTYKVPSVWRAVQSMCARGWAFIVKATTVILLCNTVVQVMQSFDWQFQVVGQQAQDSSILASVATPIAYALIPIVGYHCWQLAAATVTGFIAKENVVGTLAVCFGITDLINTESLAIADGVTASEIAVTFGGSSGSAMTAAAGLAFLVLNLFTPPCFAAIGAMGGELQSRKWLWGAIGLQIGVGYSAGFFVYQIGTLVTTRTVGVGFLPGLIAVLLFAALLVWLCVRAERKRKAEEQISADTVACAQ